MKPLPGRPPLSTRRSRGGGGEGGILSSSHKELHSSVGSVSASQSWRDVDRPSGSNPTWMKKLEDKYQRLHNKITSIPSHHSPASRFNFLTRKILNERLARTANKNDAGSRVGNSTGGGSSIKGVSTRNTSTAPNTISYKHSLQTEELISQPPNDNDSDYDLNDENFPPTRGGPGTRAVAVLNGGEGELEDSVSLSQYCPQASYSQCQPDRAGTHEPSSSLNLPLPAHGGGQGGAAASLALENFSQSRSPLLERDNALEVNNNMATELAPAAGLAYTASHPSLSQRSGEPHQAGISTTRPFASITELRHGHSASMVTSERRDTVDDGVVLVEERGEEENGGVSHRGWVSRDMGDGSAQGVRALNPLTSSGGKRGGSNKHAPMLRTAQTGISHHSHTTTKSCPAAFSSNQLPISARRGGARPSQNSASRTAGHHNMKVPVFAQMSMEARHAVTETLKEMGVADEEENAEEGEGQEENDGIEMENGYGEQYDDDNNNNSRANSNTSLPSLTDPPSALPSQRRCRHDHTATTHRSRENSNIASSHKTPTRQRSYRAPRQTDATSSVNATIRGGKSPKRTNRKPPSTHTSVNAGFRPKSERTAGTLADVRSEDVEQGHMDLDLISMASTGSAPSNRSSPEVRRGPSQRTHFPAITSRTEPNKLPMRKDNIRHVNYRIQGVGSYRVARETTFEITAPDFDVRYRDVISCQKGDRETPPPDIFEKSVGKVRDWLNKYYFSS